MLHFKGWKNGTQGYTALATIFLCTALSTCSNMIKGSTAEQYSEEIYTLIDNNAQDARKHLELFLSNSSDSLTADKFVENFYSKNDVWLWVVKDTSFIQKAEITADYLKKKACEMGFSENAFLSNQILEDVAHFRKLDFDSTQTNVGKTMASLELNLSKAYLRYSLGQRYGFTNPHQLHNYTEKRKEGKYRIVYDIPVEHPSNDFTQKALIHAGEDNPTLFLDSLECTHPAYKILKEHLEKDTTENERHLTLCNMERLRWRHIQTTDSCERYIFVNIPSQQLWAISHDSTFSMKICCGAWRTKTPLLTSKIQRIQLNPEWNIPFSILRDEVSGHGGDSAYFARRNYFIIQKSTGDTINPKNVTRVQLRSGAYHVAQHSGPRNSLGRIIFRFKNQFDVYLHDTNSRGAFNNEKRTISHGCVRVERPFDIVEFIMPNADEWLLDKMRINIDMRPVSPRGKKYLNDHRNDNDPIKPIKITSKEVLPTVPVIIDYYTLYPNPETGILEKWPDRYEYDAKILRGIKPFLH